MKNDVPDVNDPWFLCDSWRPKGARHVWGPSVKWLELNAGVSVAHLTPSPCSLFFALVRRFFPFSCFFLETIATQAISSVAASLFKTLIYASLVVWYSIALFPSKQIFRLQESRNTREMVAISYFQLKMLCV